MTAPAFLWNFFRSRFVLPVKGVTFMKKYAVLWFCLLSLLALTACGKTYTLTYEGDIPPLNDLPKSCRAGETVTITIPEVADASIHAYLNGKELDLANDGGSPTYVFAMPAEDSTVTIELVDAWIPETPAVTRSASFEDGCKTVTLQIPEGWEFEAIAASDNGITSGLRIWPTEPKDVTVYNEPFLAMGEESAMIFPSVTIGFYGYPFGVCGTGLKEETRTLSDGTEICVGYYDGSTDWSFVSFWPLDKNLAAVNNSLTGADAEQALNIMLSLTYFVE